LDTRDTYENALMLALQFKLGNIYNIHANELRSPTIVNVGI